MLTFFTTQFLEKLFSEFNQNTDKPNKIKLYKKILNTRVLFIFE